MATPPNFEHMMRNITPEQMRFAQQQMANMSPEQLKQMGQMAKQMGMSVPDDVGELERMQRMAKDMDSDQFSKQATSAANLHKNQLDYKFRAAQQLKQEGNTELTSGRSAQAKEKYERAITNLTGNGSNEARALLTVCHLNLAMCHLNLDSPFSAIESCEHALKVEPKNRKAFFRRGTAWERTGDFVRAHQDYKSSLENTLEKDAPDRPVIEQAIERVAAKLPESTTKTTPAEGESPQAQQAVETDTVKTTASKGDEQTTPRDEAATPKDAQPANAKAKPSTTQKSTTAMPPPAARPVSKGTAEEGTVEDGTTEKPQPKQVAASPSTVARSAPTTTAAAAAPSAAPPAFPGMGNRDQVLQQMKQNPAMMKSMAQMVSSMSDEQLAEMYKNAGMPITPDMARMCANMMSTMDQGTLESMVTAMPASAPQQPPLPASTPSAPTASGSAPSRTMPIMPGGMPSEAQRAQAMEQMRQNPAMMKSMAETMASMDEEQLAAISRQTGMSITPEMAKMCANMMSTMDQGTLESMASSMPTAGASTSGSTPAAMPTMPGGMPSEAQRAQAMQQMRQNPAMMKSMAQMMENMDPAQLESISRATGMPITPEMAKMCANMMSTMDPNALEGMMSAAGQQAPFAANPAASSGASSSTTATSAPAGTQNATPTSQPTPGAPGAGFGAPRLSAEFVASMSGMLSKMDPNAIATMANGSNMQVTPRQASVLVKLMWLVHLLATMYLKVKAAVRNPIGRAVAVVLIAVLVAYVLERWIGVPLGMFGSGRAAQTIDNLDSTNAGPKQVHSLEEWDDE